MMALLKLGLATPYIMLTLILNVDYFMLVVSFSSSLNQDCSITLPFEAEFGLRRFICFLIRKLLKDLFETCLANRIFAYTILIFQGLNEAEKITY